MRQHFLASALIWGVAWSQNTTSSHCCRALEDAGLQSALIYPEDVSTFETSVGKYFSQVAQLSPQCFLQPGNTAEVAQAVTALVAANQTQHCQFAVRSGGHISWPGAAGIEDGVTIDLGRMKEISYSSKDNTVSVGPGAVWGEVYQALDKLNVMTTGGRASSVGVSGLTIGGGNSFFAAQYGFVCDNVASFEVVLGNGTTVTASKDDNPDLFQVLKGGNLNFGIVTKVVLNTFPGGPFFGGNVIYPADTADQQFKALVNFGNGINDDRHASTIVIGYHDSEKNSTVFLNAYEYTKPVQRPDAKIFKEFFSIPGNISDTTGLRNMTSLAHEFEAPKDRRVQFATLTFKSDIRVLQRAHESFLKVIDELNGRMNGGYFQAWTLYQPIPTIFAKHGLEKGGNVMGLDRYDDTLIMYETYFRWKETENDQVIEEQSKWLRDDIQSFAASVGADVDWLYLNYADKDQKALEGYGAENVAKIRAAAQLYDPQGVFQNMVPGGFKISRVAETTPNGQPATSAASRNLGYTVGALRWLVQAGCMLSKRR
ncbi:Bifunctional solanapyrone synthase [Cercospora beticola]|uniref:Bifunctional solanapyrone synthase n=1 Tax=Cercospora beticola TaxID=122368 RepID=A0A2G5H9F5_CERBT|nr:Bifunctional solanapyrone synthase [Cercospora beticola]PIA89151.1 Bifunctional solanapyrone synthase [Cercospora beticola]CAK1358537.1 unnamed protein product [Cercospora beticola]